MRICSQKCLQKNKTCHKIYEQTHISLHNGFTIMYLWDWKYTKLWNLNWKKTAIFPLWQMWNGQNRTQNWPNWLQNFSWHPGMKIFPKDILKNTWFYWYVSLRLEIYQAVKLKLKKRQSFHCDKCEMVQTEPNTFAGGDIQQIKTISLQLKNITNYLWGYYESDTYITNLII